MPAMPTYRALDPDKVIDTIRTLQQRISERFPGAGLGGVCAELLVIARENSSRAEKISGRNVPLRVGIFVLLAAGAAGLGWIVSLFYRCRHRRRMSTRCCRASRRPPTCSC